MSDADVVREGEYGSVADLRAFLTKNGLEGFLPALDRMEADAARLRDSVRIIMEHYDAAYSRALAAEADAARLREQVEVLELRVKGLVADKTALRAAQREVLDLVNEATSVHHPEIDGWALAQFGRIRNALRGEAPTGAHVRSGRDVLDDARPS